MLRSIRKTITTAADGSYTFTTTEKGTGRFLGFHTAVGTMTNCTLTLSGVSTHGIATTVRTLYTKAAVGTTSHVPVRVQCVDAAGSAIAGQYDSPYLINEAVKITIASGGNAKTMDIEILLDIEQSATQGH